MLPEAFIPVVANSKFEFVPFESKLRAEENPVIARIDINQLTQVQLREPPARVSDFYRKNGSQQQAQLNGQMDEQDKRELVFFLLQKVFCIGQPGYALTPIHKEYVTLVDLICRTGPHDRKLFLDELAQLFSGRQFVVPTVFANLIKVLTAVLDSYVSAEGAEPVVGDFADFARVR